MNERIPSDWLTNAILLILVALVSYGIFLAVMVGNDASQPAELERRTVTPTSSSVQA